MQSTDWVHHTEDWATYEPMLDARAPALESRRLGSWHLSQIGTRTVLCLKSELHPATNGPQLPIITLWPAIIAEVSPSW